MTQEQLDSPLQAGAPRQAAREGRGSTPETGAPEAAPGGDGYRPPYPLFICLDGQPVTVVGAGRVAQRKVETLLLHGAVVTVVAPQATRELQELSERGAIAWERREYRDGDLAGALLAFGATSDRAVNERVYEEACRRTMLVNVVDVPDLCNAIVPSVMRRGRLQVAVSTDGASPETAKSIRHDLEDRFEPWWETYMDSLAAMRAEIKRRVDGPASRRAPLYRAVLSDGLVAEQARRGQVVDVDRTFERVVAPLLRKGRQGLA